jgi:hypothetical protein
LIPQAPHGVKDYFALIRLFISAVRRPAARVENFPRGDGEQGWDGKFLHDRSPYVAMGQVETGNVKI